MKNILDALKWRYATKVFDPNKKIPAEDFQKILDALVLSPSSYGLQPWKFVIVENPKLRAELRPHSWNQAQITDASHLIVLCRVNTIDEVFVTKFIELTAKKRGMNPHDLDGYKNMMIGDVVQGPRSKRVDEWAKDQVYIALGNLLTVAATMGIDACPMEGFDPSKYDEILNLKEKGLSSAVICALGYRSADDKYADLAKVRFDEKDVVVKM